jgi:hypothetical protein
MIKLGYKGKLLITCLLISLIFSKNNSRTSLLENSTHKSLMDLNIIYFSIF